jgi:hypothetical protein
VLRPVRGPVGGARSRRHQTNARPDAL